MRTIILHVVAFTLLLACWADDIKPLDIKVGLWERTTTIETQIPEETLAKRPPAERAKVEAMMKARNGVPRTSKVCVVRESLDKPFSIPAQDCTIKLVSSTPSRQEIHVDCLDRFAIDSVAERLDSEHVKLTTTMRSDPADASAGEGPTYFKTTISQKWLSPDCGGAKPTDAK